MNTLFIKTAWQHTPCAATAKARRALMDREEERWDGRREGGWTCTRTPRVFDLVQT
jgi:hypothetical protein